jgi:hypothetical protein
MKPAQWLLALVVLVVMVFLITFAMNYVGDSGDNKSNTNDGKTPVSYALLKFQDRKHPTDGAPPMYLEYQQTGFDDFWFENNNTDAVKVGVEWKNCTCAGVELFVVPDWERWKERKQQVDAVAKTGQVGIGLLNPLAVVPEVKDPELAKLEAAAKPIALPEKTDSVTVPPGAVGWVRIRWTGDKGPKLLTAKLWFGAPGAGQLDLETRVHFLPPLRVVASDVEPGKMPGHPLALTNLPYRDEFICWSSTRSDFEVETKVLTQAGHPTDDPFTVGKPERLTREKCADLEKNLKDEGKMAEGEVKCAWRVPIVLRDQGPGGKAAIDLGPMRRRVELSIKDDPDAGPLEVKFMAVIKGDVEVVQPGGRTPGRLDLGPFTRLGGSKTEMVQLSTTVPGVTLAVDTERTSSFLEAKLPEKPEMNGGRITWNMQVRVPPDKASGNIPRDDDPAYQDSAVYVKVIPPPAAGGPPRSIRIPVMGSAND